MGVRSLYPLEFNKNKPSMDGFEEWREHIRKELVTTMLKNRLPEGVIITQVSLVPGTLLADALSMESALMAAKQILKGGRS